MSTAEHQTPRAAVSEGLCQGSAKQAAWQDTLLAQSSSIGVSGQAFERPLGQTKGPNEDVPSLRPSHRLDYGLELGIFMGCVNAPGEAIKLDDAESYAFGMVLLNDWSAAGAVSGQKICHHHFSLGGDDAGAGTFSRALCACCTRPVTLASPRLHCQSPAGQRRCPL